MEIFLSKYLKLKLSELQSRQERRIFLNTQGEFHFLLFILITIRSSVQSWPGWRSPLEDSVCFQNKHSSSLDRIDYFIWGKNNVLDPLFTVRADPSQVFIIHFFSYRILHHGKGWGESWIIIQIIIVILNHYSSSSHHHRIAWRDLLFTPRWKCSKIRTRGGVGCLRRVFVYLSINSTSNSITISSSSSPLSVKKDRTSSRF